jgi:hypothetical protein
MSALPSDRSAAIDVARAMALPKTGLVHGSIAEMGSEQSVYCGRCQRWHEVMVSATLALAVHELIDHAD